MPSTVCDEACAVVLDRPARSWNVELRVAYIYRSNEYSYSTQAFEVYKHGVAKIVAEQLLQHLHWGQKGRMSLHDSPILGGL